MLVAAAGRFEMSQLVEASITRVELGREVGGWGIAYCYGNRLESTRSIHPCNSDPDFRKLGELRTDMAMICPDNPARVSTREVQPFTRRETGRTWAFYHHGDIVHPGHLDIGSRLPDSASPSERYFLYLMGRLDLQSPVESVTAALDELSTEHKGLSFCLMNSEVLVAASWISGDKPDTGGGARSERALWLGQGEFVRFITSQPLYSIPEITWEQLPNRSVLAMNRTRRELP